MEGPCFVASGDEAAFASPPARARILGGRVHRPRKSAGPARVGMIGPRQVLQQLANPAPGRDCKFLQ